MPELLALTYPAFDPVAIQIGPVAIRWYALAYLAGVGGGWWMMVRLLRLPGAAPMSRAQVDDFVVWAVLGVILGGRIGYVLFYNPAYFLSHPLEILQVWQGGMSFHGGLLGVIAAMVVFARRSNVPLLALTDLAAAVAPLGLLLGRAANFVNGELFGRPADVPWAMAFPAGGPQLRHPSQLYEAALEGLVLLAIVQVLYRMEVVRRSPGLVSGAFLAGYAAARLFVEGFRQPDAHIGLLAAGSTLGQWLTVPLALAGLYLIFRARQAQ